jgi:hypothetical protein
MASIRKEFVIEVRPLEAWDAARDIGALHIRLAKGFVVDTQLEVGARVVTFANGVVARELIVAIDDEARRLVWSAVGGRMTHHNASFQIFAEGDRQTRAVWIADLLPHELAGPIAAMIDDGCAAIKRTLESAHAEA